MKIVLSEKFIGNRHSAAGSKCYGRELDSGGSLLPFIFTMVNFFNNIVDYFRIESFRNDGVAGEIFFDIII